MDTDPAPEAPNSADLRAFLKSDAPPNSVQFDVPPEVAAEMPEMTPEAKAQEQPMARTEIPMNPAFNPEQATVANILYWTMKLPDIGEVTVTDTEKALYLKAVDHDAPVVYEIEIPMGPNHLRVEVKSRSVLEERSIFAALDYAAYERKDFHDPGAFATRAQQLMGAVQVVSINGRPLPLLDITPANGDIRKAAGLIESQATLVIDSMSGPRWGAVLTALRIAEVKIKLCNDNANNETFWTPAS